MHGLGTGGHRRAGVAASVHDVFPAVVLSVIEQSLDTGLSEAPGTSVERLLLGPDDRLGVRVLVKVLLQLLPREGVQLLKTGDGDVVNLVIGAVLVEGGPDLTRAKNDSVNLLRRLDGARLVLRVGDDPLEASILASELLNVAAGQRVTEQRLGEEDDESYGIKLVNRRRIIDKRMVENLRFRNWRCICRRRAWNRLAGVVM